MQRYLLISFFFLTQVVAFAQEDAKTFVSGLIEELAQKDDEVKDYSELLEDLIAISEHKININTATRDDLQQLPFLSDLQIENILYYVYTNGPLFSLYELQAVEGLDVETAQKLTWFLSTEQSAKVSKRMQGELMARTTSLLQTPVGYQYNSEKASAYIGSKMAVWNKYRISANDRIEAGFTFEKDAGEPFMNKQNSFADFHSGFLRIKNKGLLRTLLIGDYTATFGQGLGLWTGMAFGKSPSTISLSKRGKGLVRFSSTNESSFLRGIGAELKYKNWSFSPFLSHKNVDATIVNDTVSGESYISSIKDIGYHRTESELAAKNSVRETVAGAAFEFDHSRWQVYAGGVYWDINQTLNPTQL